MTTQYTHLPIFPLPGAVLFPGAVMPLHIFEERYREMIRDALDGDSLLGIARIEPGSEDMHFGAPPVVPIMGVGRIVSHELLDDGRYYIMLMGVDRIRVDTEHENGLLYRTIDATVITDPDDDAASARERKETLRRLCLGLNALHPALASSLLTVLEQVKPEGRCANVLASVVFPEAEDRQQMLEETDATKRFDAVIDRIAALLAKSAPSDGFEN